MTRVIAGVAGGRTLVVPAGTTTRPTADRAREGLFSTLTSLRGGLDGVRFLDLYAGSGAVGIEAASRGASNVVLVDSDPRAIRAARSNVDALNLAGVEVRAERVERMLAEPAVAFDVVFLDPPYADPVDAVLTLLAGAGWLAPDAVVCVERASRGEAMTWPAGIAPVRARRYGEATLWYGRRP
jgi:16S rRNA (guanine966-N2)-methyltransferase